MADPDRVLLQPDVYQDWYEPFPEIPPPPVQQVQSVHKNGSTWPDRPTDDPSVLVIWIGPDPSPPGATAPAVNGMYPDDLRIIAPAAGGSESGGGGPVASVDGRIGAVSLSDRYAGLDAQGRTSSAQMPLEFGTFGRDRGSGATLPTTDLRRGDTFLHTPTSALWAYTGASWRPATEPSVANAAARDALTNGRFTGLRVEELDTGRIVRWDGTRWRKVGGPPELIHEVINAAGSGNVPPGPFAGATSTTIPAHTPGNLLITFDGNWIAAGGAAMTCRFLVGATVNTGPELAGAQQRTHNNGQANASIYFSPEGRYTSDGTSKVVTLQIQPEAFGVTILTANWKVWLA